MNQDNTGHRNTGHYNTGDCNTGHYNTGDFNTGHYNTGNRNTGDFNTGDFNTGYRNTGDWNTGDYNTGHFNTGHYNTGDYNTGHRNTGYWNTGDWNTGYFCTETPAATFFDHPTNLTHDEARDLIPSVDLPVGTEWVDSSEMTDKEKADNPGHITTGGYLKTHTLPIQESFPIAWAKMTDEERSKWRSLPKIVHCTTEKSIELFGVDITAPAKRAPTVTIKLADGTVLSGELVEGEKA